MSMLTLRDYQRMVSDITIGQYLEAELSKGKYAEIDINSLDIISKYNNNENKESILNVPAIKDISLILDPKDKRYFSNLLNWEKNILLRMHIYVSKRTPKDLKTNYMPYFVELIDGGGCKSCGERIFLYDARYKGSHMFSLGMVSDVLPKTKHCEPDNPMRTCMNVIACVAGFKINENIEEGIVDAIKAENPKYMTNILVGIKNSVARSDRRTDERGKIVL